MAWDCRQEAGDQAMPLSSFVRKLIKAYAKDVAARADMRPAEGRHLSPAPHVSPALPEPKTAGPASLNNQGTLNINQDSKITTWGHIWKFIRSYAPVITMACAAIAAIIGKCNYDYIRDPGRPKYIVHLGSPVKRMIEQKGMIIKYAIEKSINEIIIAKGYGKEKMEATLEFNPVNERIKLKRVPSNPANDIRLKEALQQAELLAAVYYPNRCGELETQHADCLGKTTIKINYYSDKGGAEIGKYKSLTLIEVFDAGYVDELKERPGGYGYFMNVTGRLLEKMAPPPEANEFHIDVTEDKECRQ